MEATISASAAGFESIFDSQSVVNAAQGQLIDLWDDCYDCNYNCEECDNI